MFEFGHRKMYVYISNNDRIYRCGFIFSVYSFLFPLSFFFSSTSVDEQNQYFYFSTVSLPTQ